MGFLQQYFLRCAFSGMTLCGWVMQYTKIDFERTGTTLFDPEYEGAPFLYYSHASHNDVLVNDGPHIQRWSHKIII